MGLSINFDKSFFMELGGDTVHEIGGYIDVQEHKMYDIGKITKMSDKENRDDTSDVAEDEVVTLDEIIDAETEHEQLVGGIDTSMCTFTLMPNRQPVYLCVTCRSQNAAGGDDSVDPKAGSAAATAEVQAPDAGVCYSCSLHCHEGHEMVELYTKRSFACDCGNSAFPKTNPCQLYAEKPAKSFNKYNHNFRGLYCTCDRPYPDADDDVVDDMLQCVVCEDWFHRRHLAGLRALAQSADDSGASDGGGGEITCQNCMANSAVLPAYAKSIFDNNAANQATRHLCIKALQPISDDDAFRCAVQWPVGWRLWLCKCADCEGRYFADGVAFLTDENDDVSVYSSKAMEASEKVAMSSFVKQDRVVQNALVQGISEIQDSLLEFLRSHPGGVVTAADMEQFKEKLFSRKRKHSDDNDPPRSCR